MMNDATLRDWSPRRLPDDMRSQPPYIRLGNLDEGSPLAAAAKVPDASRADRHVVCRALPLLKFRGRRKVNAAHPCIPSFMPLGKGVRWAKARTKAVALPCFRASARIAFPSARAATLHLARRHFVAAMADRAFLLDSIALCHGESLARMIGSGTSVLGDSTLFADVTVEALPLMADRRQTAGTP